MGDQKLAGRVALITGAGRGIGRAIALAFAEQGARIAAIARTESELNSVTAEIHRMDQQAIALPADLLDRSKPKEIVRQVQAAFGTVDILVNNAGVGSGPDPRPVADFDDNFWDESLALNLTAPYLLCKAVVPVFLQRKRGCIINIASIAGKIGLFHGVAYSASKHALMGLTRTAAMETAAQGITVK